MANWTETEISLILPTKFVEKFYNYFINYEGRDEASPCFYRTSLNGEKREDNGKGYSRLYIDCSCAWNIGCLTYPPLCKTESQNIIDIQSAIRECKVKRLNLYSEEPGVGFWESLEYDAELDDIYTEEE